MILLSRNSADTGLRIFNSIQHYGLGIIRATFTAGEPTWPYVKPFGTDLFLSANPESVRSALRHGIAAATILPKPPGETAAAAADQIDTGRPAGQLRIAFDGDAVIFGDESERISREQGVEAFGRHERERAREPLSGGPFRGFLSALHTLQEVFPAGESAPIRTALVTARSAPAHERVIRTLREWGVRLDEALFLGGRHKGRSCRRSVPTSSSMIRSTTSTVRANTWPPATYRTVSPTRGETTPGGCQPLVGTAIIDAHQGGHLPERCTAVLDPCPPRWASTESSTVEGHDPSRGGRHPQLQIHHLPAQALRFQHHFHRRLVGAAIDVDHEAVHRFEVMLGVLQWPCRLGRAEGITALQFIAAALPQHVALQHCADPGRGHHGFHRCTAELVAEAVEQGAERAGRYIRAGLAYQIVVELGAQAAAHARKST